MGMPSASSLAISGMWEKPQAPPPLSASPTVRPSATRARRWKARASGDRLITSGWNARARRETSTCWRSRPSVALLMSTQCRASGSRRTSGTRTTRRMGRARSTVSPSRLCACSRSPVDVGAVHPEHPGQLVRLLVGEVVRGVGVVGDVEDHLAAQVEALGEGPGEGRVVVRARVVGDHHPADAVPAAHLVDELIDLLDRRGAVGVALGPGDPERGDAAGALVGTGTEQQHLRGRRARGRRAARFTLSLPWRSTTATVPPTSCAREAAAPKEPAWRRRGRGARRLEGHHLRRWARGPSCPLATWRGAPGDEHRSLQRRRHRGPRRTPGAPCPARRTRRSSAAAGRP